jgi:hypothetical protein
VAEPQGPAQAPAPLRAWPGGQLVVPVEPDDPLDPDAPLPEEVAPEAAPLPLVPEAALLPWLPEEPLEPEVPLVAPRVEPLAVPEPPWLPVAPTEPLALDWTPCSPPETQPVKHQAATRTTSTRFINSPCELLNPNYQMD